MTHDRLKAMPVDEAKKRVIAAKAAMDDAQAEHQRAEAALVRAQIAHARGQLDAATSRDLARLVSYGQRALVELSPVPEMLKDCDLALDMRGRLLTEAMRLLESFVNLHTGEEVSCG